jgi:hypothetical protein
MPKRAIFVFCLFFTVCGFVFSQISDEIKQELINLYTQYAQSRTGIERLNYIRNSESYRTIFETRYGDRDVSYTPIRFGNVNRTQTNSNMELYVLEEYVSANRSGRPTEIIQYRYFIKLGNIYKLDWEASVCYNAVPLSRFSALKDGQIASIRCYAILRDSRYDNYFAFSILDEATNSQFRAYILKNSEDGLALLEYLENGSARPVILEMRYVDNINQYDKEVLITKFKQRGWVQ